MDGFIDFFVSINKIALIAFVAVFGFLSYEIKKLIDEKKKKEKPIVPQFNNTVQIPSPVAVNSTPLPSLASSKLKGKDRSPLLIIIIGIISLVGVAGLAVMSYNTNISKQRVATNSAPIVKEITSDGLKIYNESWNEIEGNRPDMMQPGKKLYIGIKTIVEADIDRARIKINSNDWQISDITTLFNQQHKVYYKDYTVATGTAQLKIDAQLHSASDGWLGE